MTNNNDTTTTTNNNKTVFTAQVTMHLTLNVDGSQVVVYIKHRHMARVCTGGCDWLAVSST